jgi:hypothetical protein
MVIDTMSQKFHVCVGTALLISTLRVSVAASYTGLFKVTAPPVTGFNVVTLLTYLSNPVLEAHKNVMAEAVAAAPLSSTFYGCEIVLK